MYAPVTITDLTRMQGDHICVAGYLRDGTCIRPIFPRRIPLTKDWVWTRNKVVIRPFAEVELELMEHTPHPPHTEDYIVSPTYYRLLRHLDPARRQALLLKIEDPSVQSIFGAPIQLDNGWYLQAGQGTRSLGTVKAEEIVKISYAVKEGNRWDYRISFKDSTGALYKLAVTDLAFRFYMDDARLRQGQLADKIALNMTSSFREGEVFLRIGLARGCDRFPDRCHLQITGVYSFPDYLGGKCFADFAPEPRSAPVEDIPF